MTCIPSGTQVIIYLRMLVKSFRSKIAFEYAMDGLKIFLLPVWEVIIAENEYFSHWHADVHGYFTELITALTGKGFFEDTEPHKLVICGGLYDRGTEALRLQEFISDLLAKGKVILIGGNHKDLAMEMLLNNMAEKNTAGIGFEKQIWDAACLLRGSIDASAYKRVALGRIFLKSTSEGIFLVPANACWSVIASRAHTPEICAVSKASGHCARKRKQPNSFGM